MFYKKRIEALEIKLDRLTKELEENEAIGSYGPYVFGYAPHRNERLSARIEHIIRIMNGHSLTIEALIDYLGVEYVTKPMTKRLIKRKKGVVK